jgi:hypothetical protein
VFTELFPKSYKKTIAPMKSQNSFFKSSALFSVVNLLASAIAYVIIVLVSRKGGDLINDWSALNGLVTIFLTFTAGFSLYYSKTVSRIAKDSPKQTENYLATSEDFLHTLARKWGWVMIAILLILAWVLKFLTWYQAVLIAVNLYFELWAILYRMYFLGRLEYNKSMVLTFAAAVTRFVGIVGLLLFTGLGIDSLVIGNLFGSILALVVSKLYVKHKGTISAKFEIAKDFVSSIKASVALIVISVLLQAGQIITQGLYDPADKTALTTVTMLNLFGSIVFYGASSFLALFVVNATRSESTDIYKKGTAIIGGVSVLGIVVITLLWNIALTILKRDEFKPLLPQFLYYSIFMVAYNMLFVGIQFLISQYKYTTIFKLGVGIVSVVVLLILNAIIPFSHSNYILYYSSILIGGTVLLFGYSYYLITKKAQ